MTTTPLDLAALGITKEELQNRLVERMAEQLLAGVSFDEDGELEADTALRRKLDTRVREQIDATINAIAERHILPNVATYIETMTLTETNRWGEAKGAPVTFIEYLVQRADAYMREEVDFNGKTKAEESYNWRRYGTRVAQMIDKHLAFSIQTAMEGALKNANASIIGGLEQAVKIALAGVSTQLKVTLDTKRA